MLDRGESPRTAERFAVQQAGHPDVASAAIGQPRSVTPKEFGRTLMRECLKHIEE